MAIAIQSGVEALAFEEGVSSAVSVTPAATPTDGNVVVLVICVANLNGFSAAPAGFTLRESEDLTNVAVYLYTKTASSESGAYTATLTTADEWLAWVTTLSGVDTTASPIDATASTYTGVGATSDTQAVTTTQDNSASVVIQAIQDDSPAFDSPLATGYTDFGQAREGSAGSDWSFKACYLLDQGSAGVKTATTGWTNNAIKHIIFHTTFLAAAVGGGSTTSPNALRVNSGARGNMGVNVITR